MFAVLKTGGKQYKVAKNDIIEIERLPGEAGETIVFDQILMVGDGASVAGTLLEQAKGDKVIVFKKRRRHNYRRKRGHRQELSVVRIDEILTDGARPTAKPAGAAATEA